jgi:hypothetical protein
MMGPWDREDGFGHFVKNEDFLKSGIVLKNRDSFDAGLKSMFFSIPGRQKLAFHIYLSN